MLISHGIPNHPYFAIAQPPSVAKPTVDVLNADYVKPILDLQDPNSQEKYQAELQDMWTYSLKELEGQNLFCLLIYGIESKKLLKVLEKRYPEITQTQKVRILVLKKI